MVYFIFSVFIVYYLKGINLRESKTTAFYKH